MLIECKNGSNFDAGDVEAFNLLNDTRYQMNTNAIICNSLEAYSIREDVIVLPLSSI